MNEQPEDDFEAMREAMLETIAIHARLAEPYTERTSISEAVLEAMRKVPRHEFVPFEIQPFAYLDRPLPIAKIRKFKPDLVAEVDRLLDRYCDREIAAILNQCGHRTWEGKAFNLKKIAYIRDAYDLPSRYHRLRGHGMLTTREVAARFAVSEAAVDDWERKGLIKKWRYDNLNRGLWQLPTDHRIIKGQSKRPARLEPITSSSTEQGAV